MTSLTFHLARALGRRLGPGDAIVVTELDHHANIDPWRALERERGVTILQVPMIPETGELDWNDLDRCLSDHRTRLLAIGAASNALGTINDVARAVAMAREAEVLSFVDAVHFAPHQLVDVQDVGLRLSGLLDLQVLRTTPRGAFWPARAARVRSTFQAPARSRYDSRNGSRPGRKTTRGSSARRPRWTIWLRSHGKSMEQRQRLCGLRLRAVFESLHERGSVLLKHLWDELSQVPGCPAFRSASERTANTDARIYRRWQTGCPGQP